jgi:hypothetical protein
MTNRFIKVFIRAFSRLWCHSTNPWYRCKTSELTPATSTKHVLCLSLRPESIYEWGLVQSRIQRENKPPSTALPRSSLYQEVTDRRSMDKCKLLSTTQFYTWVTVREGFRHADLGSLINHFNIANGCQRIRRTVSYLSFTLSGYSERLNHKIWA